MARKGSDVTEAELCVMQVLWNYGPQTIREVTVVLDAPHQDVYYATVKKLLDVSDSVRDTFRFARSPASTAPRTDKGK